MTTFGSKLQEYMDWAGLSQKELAGLTGISRSMISGYIVGTRNPTLKALEKLASVLDVSVWALINGDPMAVKQEDITKEETKIIGEYRRLTGDERKLIQFTFQTLNKHKIKPHK